MASGSDGKRGVEGDAALVIGAGGAIAQAVIQALLDEPEPKDVLTVSRHPDHPQATTHICCDNSPADIERIISELQPWNGRIGRVFVCQGILHSDTVQPEKKLEDIDEQMMLEVLNINTVIPMLWVSRLLPLIKAPHDCTVTVFSARVGSITDNHKGGWYSYRASKAALNMLLKTAAIEYGRRARNVKLVAFHPGTVDTPLSQPFQRNVPENKLFTPQYVAQRLLEHLATLPPDGTLSYIDWDGKVIDW